MPRPRPEPTTADDADADDADDAETRLGCPALEKILIYPISIYICVRMRTQSLTASSASVLASGVGAKTMAVASARSVDSCLAARPSILT